MDPAGGALPPDYREAVAALSRTIAGQLRDELDAAGTGRTELAEEFRRRRDDYRTWHRMGEVPPRIAELADRLVRGEPAPAARGTLELAVLAAMADAHGQALAQGAPADAADGSGGADGVDGDTEHGRRSPGIRASRTSP